MTKKTILSEAAAEYLVEMWCQKGNISGGLRELTVHHLLNHEFESDKVERWADEVRKWKAAQHAA
ncbi:hypothetical protein KC722_00620 [Candidatus Kaiserbacteria bacterium]|nr:hypothetical protein [Candidatus Kaiserbacteria bacterium]MCB9811788.1 hypothetical protein [Candidatus Nomurabacteria bacterium]